jgi:3-oxoacyl-[acyl-carrier-protein] synthase III
LCAISVKGVRIGGIAACVPAKVINNRDFGHDLYGDDLDGTLKVIGVEERRICPEGMVTGAHSLLGLPENATAFDINLACSGYPW